jgi:hypothetical protein
MVAAKRTWLPPLSFLLRGSCPAPHLNVPSLACCPSARSNDRVLRVGGSRSSNRATASSPLRRPNENDPVGRPDRFLHCGEEDLNLHTSRHQHLKPQNQLFPSLSHFVAQHLKDDRERLCSPLKLAKFYRALSCLASAFSNVASNARGFKAASLLLKLCDDSFAI